MNMVRGIIPAVVTPFTADERVDEAALARLVEKLIHNGVNGLYINGSTSEAFLLGEEERKRCLEVVMETVAGRLPVIAHVGAIGTELTIRYLRHAQSLGVAAVSACAPFYYPFRPAEILRFYKDVSAQTDLPMVCYNFPAQTGFTLTVEMLEELNRANPRICAVKNTTFDLFLLERFKHSKANPIVYCGHDEVFLSGLAAGADGAIGSTFNIMSGAFLEIWKRYQNGDIAGAAAIQSKANAMIEMLIRYGVYPSIKSILRQLNIVKNGCRRPFFDTDAEQDQALLACYEATVAPYQK